MAETDGDDLQTEAEKPEVVEKPEVTEGETPKETDEVVVTIGEESPASEEEPAPEWVRELRRKNREDQRTIRELQQQLKGQSQPEKVFLGQKPTLEACDYDAERFETELESWHARKREQEAEADKKRTAQEAEKAAWQAKLDGYGKAKADLKVKDYEDAEATALEALSTVQQGIILSGSETPALVVYALGKNPAKAKELASISDPVKFAFAIAKLESQLKVSPRKDVPPPEKVVSVSGRAAPVDSTLARLEAEAEKSGDRTKIFQYKQQLRAKSK